VKHYFFQLLNVHRVSDVRQTEIHTSELLVLHPSNFDVGSAIANLRRYKSTGSDQIPAELVLARGEILHSKFHKFHQVEEDQVGRACSTNGRDEKCV
jgi:hypothetical protein